MKQPKWHIHDADMFNPAFEEGDVIVIETRDGRVMEADQPWTLVGWNHTGWVNDIVRWHYK